MQQAQQLAPAGIGQGLEQHVLGMLILHERPGLGGIIAFVLILFGSWLATRDAPREPEGSAAAST
jgi:drug/metabolite transporter (DMT)-like permease